MKIIILSVSITLIVASLADSAEYRSFTNLEGTVIVARVVDYDEQGGRVQLELKNRKKAWIKLSTLSEADQDYIHQVKLQATETAGSAVSEAVSKKEPLSKKELTALGEQYVSLVDKARSQPEMKALFLNPERMEYWGGSLNNAIVRIWIKGAYPDDGLIYLQTEAEMIPDSNPRSISGYTTRTLGKRDGRGIDMYPLSYDHIWLMVTPDGKIKYDTLQCRHPLQIATLCVRYLESNYTFHVQRREGGPDVVMKNWAGNVVSIDQERFEDIKTVYHQLKDLGIPLYGFDLSSSERDFEKTIRQIKKWLIKNGKEWDVSEPKVYIPSDLYKQIKKRLS